MNYSAIKRTSYIIVALLVCCLALNVNAQSYRLPGQHAQQSQNRIASQNTSRPNALVTPTINYLDFEEESEPEGDLYEYGWNSNMVNCYGNMQVPDHAVIDVRNFSMPHPGYLTSPYGWRERFKRMHKGVDLHANIGDTIRAAFDGRVRITNYEAKGYGNYVVLRHYNDLETVYGHMTRIIVKPGQEVKAGDAIGLAGSTGRSTGPHLHFETRYMGYAINPAAIFDFANQTTHTDTYTFDKRTYQDARNFSPQANANYAAQYNQANPRRAANNASSASGSKGKTSSQSKYVTVKKGDSLARIANNNNTTVDKICKLNGVTTKTKIQPGQKLRVR